MPIIKVVDSELANALNALGYESYIEKINGGEVHCFIADDSLIQYVTSKYEKSKFFISKRMTF